MSEQTFTISNINDKPGLVVKGNNAEQMAKDIKEIMPVFRDFEAQFKPQPVRPAVTPQGNPQVSHTPYQDKPVRDVNEGTKCQKCGADRVNNPKTGKWFCEKKCWLGEGNATTYGESRG